MKRFFCFALLCFLSVSFVFADEINMEFRNQKITDIIYSLAQIEDRTVYCDETVTGNATFSFNDRNFDIALGRFCSAYSLFAEK